MTYNVAPLIEQLRAARIAQGLTRIAVARRLGIGANRIGEWERGDVVPKASALAAWADAVGKRLTLEDAT